MEDTTMKKYIQPSIMVITIKTQQMLASSPTTSETEWQSTDPILSRESDFFDDEDFWYEQNI